MSSSSSSTQEFLQLIIFFFCSVSLLVLCPVAYSISFEFTSFSPKEGSNCTEGSGGVCIQGDAMILDNGVIQLTINDTYNNDFRPLSIGRAVYSDPILLWNSTTQEMINFTTHFSFAMDVHKIINETNYGDGMAFFLSPYPSKIPSDPGESLMGLFNNATARDHLANTIVAVEFDTWSNDWDIFDGDHVGIDVNTIDSIVATEWNGSLNDGKIANSWVTYDSTTFNLSVFLTFDAELGLVDLQPCLSYVVDLRKILPERIAVGFSSSSYLSQEKHFLLSWNFTYSSLEQNQINKTIQTNQTSPAGSKNGTDSSTPQHNNNSSSLGLKVGVPVSIVAVVVLVLVIAGLSFTKKGAKKNSTSSIAKGERLQEFSYSSLAVATNTFSAERRLGVGGSGAVYSGFLPDLGIDVAIKKFSIESAQGEKAFETEVNIISTLRHRNLVKLIGWCHDKDKLLLVYELMSNRSLDHWLFKPNDSSILPWNQRYKIAVGLASAVHYLHEEWEQCVIHRDIKSSNVMLDTNFNAKLGDFGLARFAEHGVGLKTTTLFGTVGYMAPECFQTGKSTKESDIYGFGVVLLEIASGRRASEVQLVEWVWENNQGCTLLEVADANMELDEVEKEQVTRLTLVGLWCSNPNPNLRPSIRQVVSSLDLGGPLPRVPAEALPVSSDYSSSNQTDYFPSPSLRDHVPYHSLRVHTGPPIHNLRNKFKFDFRLSYFDLRK